MAINIIPPVAITNEEKNDLTILETLISLLSNVLDTEATIASENRVMSSDAIDSLNNTLIDASDRIDAIINPPAPLS